MAESTLVSTIAVSEAKETKGDASSKALTPVLFISHGAGPCFFLDSRGGLFSEIDRNSDAPKLYQNIPKLHNLGADSIKGIVVLSAHWETSGTIEVFANEHHDLFFDYYGFPEEAYALQWSPKGDPELAQQVIELLKNAGMKAKPNKDRGYDHGAFVPLKLAYPNGDVPVIQVSILSHLDPETHYKMGQALRPLREQGILIVGSGQATHGRAKTPVATKEFVSWLTATVTSDELSAEQRTQKLFNIATEAPHFGSMHPRTEHFVPIYVALGATDGARGELMFDKMAGAGMISLASYKFS